MATPPRISEKQFMGQVRQLAAHLGWKCYHTGYSLGSDAGWPDLTLVRPTHGDGPRIIFAELKSQAGTVSAAQKDWLDTLKACRCLGVKVQVWRPSDLDSGRIPQLLAWPDMNVEVA